MKSDEYWMEQCFKLASYGNGNVSPNPLVGAVIVKNGKLLGKGFHKQYAHEHAEVIAINDAKKKHKNLLGATIYVNLEPCFHYGNTPPCVDAILKEKISKVVIASKDPNPQVSGKSIQKLRRNGVTVVADVLKSHSEHFNEKFFKFISTKIPFVALKAAQTKDGFIAQENGTSKWITNAQSRKFVHQLRSEYDAVLVGANTVKQDNPELTVRMVRGRNPLRIVLSSKLDFNLSYKIFNTEFASTIVYTCKSNSQKHQNIIKILEHKNVVVTQIVRKDGRINVMQVLKDLARHGISSVLVEGGAEIYNTFLKENLVDKIYLFTSEKEFGNGIAGIDKSQVVSKFNLLEQKKYNRDVLQIYSLR